MADTKPAPSRGARVNADVAALLKARHTLLWVVSREEARAERALVEAAASAKYETRLWDCARGVTDAQGERPRRGSEDPAAALDLVRDDKARAVYVFRDLHKWFDPLVLRRLRNLARSLESAPSREARTVVILTPSGEVPPELAGHATVVDYPLPDRQEVAQILADAVSALPPEIQASALPDADRDAAVDAAVGLTAQEAANCYAKSLVTCKRVDPALVSAEKRRVITREKVLTWYEPDPRGMDAVGGLACLKGWLTARRSALTPRARAFGLPAPKGVLLVGPPGCLRGDTLVYDPVDGTTLSVRRRCEAGIGFHVLAMGKDGPVRTAALPPKKFEVASMIEFTTDTGQKFAVTPAHQFRGVRGWIYASEAYKLLRESEHVQLASSSGSDQPVPCADALRWSEKAPGSLVDCRRGLRSDDEQLHVAEDVDRGVFPSRVGVHGHTHHDLRVDDLEDESARSRACPSSDPPSTLDSGDRKSSPSRSGHPREPEQREPRALREPGASSSRAAGIPRAVSSQRGTSREPLHDELPSKDVGDFSWSTERCTMLVSARQVDAEHYYDFHVPIFENYWAAGAWHHNTGKSLTAKCIASTWGVPLLRLDLGALRSKWVGESESNLRRALSTAEAVSPCVLWLDEVEKALAGSTSAASDGGVSADALGAVLSWMQERQGAVFVVATANDVRGLPPELIRKGRFDEVFWLDLPTEAERAEVFRAAVRERGRDPESVDVLDLAKATRGFTGAEIAAVVPDALFLAFADGERALTTEDIRASVAAVTPLSVTAGEKLELLREWAKGRARPASAPEVEERGPQRAVDLDPDAN